jgi:hypothetical protein
MKSRFKNKFAIAGVALATAAFAGGAYAATQSGTNQRQAFLQDVAHRLNVSPQQLTAAMKAAMIDRINEAVKAGRITQAQANKLEQRVGEGKLPLLFGGAGAHRGRGLVRGELKAASSYLGLTEKQLIPQLRDGKTLAQVAQAQGKTTAGLEQALTAALKTRLDKAVARGRITSAQEQQLMSRLQTRLDKRVNRPFKLRHP